MDPHQDTISILVRLHIATVAQGSNLSYLRSILGNSSPNKWILHLAGGGWCYDEDECVKRSKGNLGSSKNWPPSLTYSGLLSDNCTINPDFCGWSMVYIGYCDGASFAGNV